MAGAEAPVLAPRARGPAGPSESGAEGFSACHLEVKSFVEVPLSFVVVQESA